MIASMQKWGNSLAVRIPKPLADILGIGPGSQVRIAAEQGRIVITAAAKYSLEELLEGITPANLHGETNLGKPAGKEVW